ncbi:MAG TPA: serine/threonine-protein kinase [Gemmataceae bacterium]|nr:serine/threonine-protein kinase [Gemmataceae bacterium]
MKSASPASSDSTAPPDLVGETFDDFRILRRLGQGGMGQVYLAEQISLQRKVAVKMLREDIAAHPVALERFKVESKTVAQLSHANVVQVHAFGQRAGRCYMVMEYVEGKNLREYLVRQGPLDAPLVLSIMRQVANALHRASELGIVHRDIKPENILLTKKGEAKVADFGLSRCLAVDAPVDLTRAGATVGTPLFMSPEQVEGKAVDHRSDIYSFGVTCYQMLTGRTPFQGSNAFEIALKHVRQEPAPLQKLRPDVPPALCAIVHKMMAKKRRARYQSARDLLKDIARVRKSLGGSTGAVPIGAETTAAEEEAPPAVPLWKRPEVRRWAVPALAALGVFIMVLIGVALLWRRPAASTEAVAVAPPPPASPKADNAPPPSPAPPPPPAAAVPSTPTATPPSAPPTPPADATPPDREEALKKLVEQHLQDTSSSAAGVEDCLDLGVLYLDQNHVSDAEALFARMDEHKSSPAYHFVGRLGLAVTDSLKHDYRDSRAKLMELLNPRNHDSHEQMLHDYMTKNPDFAKWVNEAEAQNVRSGLGESPFPEGWRRFPSKPPFRKP